jgi:hypothetical protein
MTGKPMRPGDRRPAVRARATAVAVAVVMDAPATVAVGVAVVVLGHRSPACQASGAQSPDA